jgi:hypothetical protein
MKLKRLPLLGLLLFIISVAIIPGVYATWQYAISGPSPQEITIGIELAEYKWDGSENLPDAVQGEDHAWLIFSIVCGEGIGLNDSDSVLNDRIDDRVSKSYAPDYFGSMAVTGGDEIQEIFDTKTEGLQFIVHAASDTEYYIYTTSVDLGERGEGNTFGNKEPGKPNIPIGEWIYPVYRTKLVRANKKSDFEIVETKRGRAKSAWYKETQIVSNTRSQIPSFDILDGNWQEIEMGYPESPILTFVGDNPTAYATKTLQHVYYKLTPKSAGTYTIWTDNLDAKIRILSSPNSDAPDSSAIAISTIVTQADGSQRVSLTWSASKTTYYIEVTGDDVMQFHIQ